MFDHAHPLRTLPPNFPVDGEAANLLATSRCNGIWETTRHNRQLVSDGLVVYVADLLRKISVGLMDFGL